jgi:thiamine-phosphate pyrophosphorylase
VTTSPKPGNPSRPLHLPLLYPIVDVDLCQMKDLDPVAFAAGCIRGGARLLQVRKKGSAEGTSAFVDIVRAVIDVSRPAGARVIVNDRADVAAMAGADGVHVGQQDLPPADVRRVVGDSGAIGLSTHTAEQIDDAAAGTADYIAVGPVFRTTTKETGYDPRGLELVRYARRTGKPVVAIGGITSANAREVLAAGASSVAVISDLLTGDDPAVRVREFLEIVADGR